MEGLKCLFRVKVNVSGLEGSACFFLLTTRNDVSCPLECCCCHCWRLAFAGGLDDLA